MSVVFESGISLDSFTLLQLDFKIDPAVKPKESPLALKPHLQIQVSKLDESHYSTICSFRLESTLPDGGSPFSLSAICKIDCSATAAGISSLERFANSGAAFNALMYFRELTREITSRSEIGPVILPPLNLADNKPVPPGQ